MNRVPKMRRITSLLRNWLASGWAYFKRDLSIQDITVIDLVMQCASFKLWTLYLVYTAIRCLVLFTKYSLVSFSASEEEKRRKKQLLWSQVQLYLMAKVTGIVVSQTVLVLIGLSTIGWAATVLVWGAVLSLCSMFAYQRKITIL